MAIVRLPFSSGRCTLNQSFILGKSKLRPALSILVDIFARPASKLLLAITIKRKL